MFYLLLSPRYSLSFVNAKNAVQFDLELLYH